MPAFRASAPGKIILLGEHAVVYGRPAIAVPVRQVQVEALAWAEPSASPGALHIQAPEIGLDALLSDLPSEHPLAATVHLVCTTLGVAHPPAGTLRIISTIPVAAGLGSGAAVAVAVLRAFSAFLGHPLNDVQVAALAYEVEKLHHGTPSGIDNTVVTYAMPVYFVRGQPIATFEVGRPFTLVIGDTGIASSTAVAVGDLRRRWQANGPVYERCFDAVGQIVDLARQHIAAGQVELLGPLMDQNHRLLQQMGVSSPELDRLVQAARAAGALGAKLSGGGCGGNMIALVAPDRAIDVAAALGEAGAVRTIVTEVTSAHA